MKKIFFSTLDKYIVEWFVFAFAVWTICSNIAAFTGMSLYGLLLLYTCAAFFAFFLFFVSIKKRTLHATAEMRAPAARPGPALESSKRYWGFSAYSAALLVLFFSTRNFSVFWWGAVIYFLAALWCSRKAVPEQTSAPCKNAVLLLWLAAFLMAGVVLFSHRSDADDVNYVSAAAWFADHPQQALFSANPVYPLEKLPYLFPPHKVEALPSLAAAASVLTGLPAIALLHLVFPAFWAVLCVFAHGLLLRALAPRHWPWILIALEATLLALGELHREWGNFSYLRMQHGKSFFLTFFFPLITLYGLKLGQKLEWRIAALLCAAQIGGMGMSSTAVWAAPTMGGVALLSGMAGFRGQGKRVAVFCLTVSYALLMGGLLYCSTLDAPAMLVLKKITFDNYPERLLALVVGWSPLAFCIWYATLTAWLLCPTGLSRRFALLSPLIVLLFFLNPYLAPFVAHNITSGILYWRILWLLPAPLFCALALSSPFFFKQPLRMPGVYFAFLICGLGLAAALAPHFGQGFLASKAALGSRYGLAMLCFLLALLAAMLLQERTRPKNERALPRALAFFTLLVSSFLFFLPTQYLLSAENSVQIHRPALKVPPDAYDVAQWIARHFTPQDRVLLPEMQSTWLPAFSHHPSPVITVKYWDRLMRGIWTDEDLHERVWLRAYVMGDLDQADQTRFRNGLARYAVAAVSMKQSAPYIAQTRTVLQEADYKLGYAAYGYEVWTKKISVK